MKGDWDVLIVDDDQNMRLTLAEILAGDGYDVRVASTGEESVEMCRENRFRLILMDVRMPGIGGLEAFRQIRKQRSRCQTVLMSAYTDFDFERAALREGVLRFLKKPLDIESVAQLIAEVTSTAVVYVGGGDRREQLQDALRRDRIQPTFVSSVGEALALADQIDFDVIALDLEDDTELLRILAALRGLHPATPIVVATNSAGPSSEIGRQALVSGAYAVLAKPFSGEALSAFLEQAKHTHRRARTA
jgi:DNA-binding NtrC family response regulator